MKSDTGIAPAFWMVSRMMASSGVTVGVTVGTAA